MLELKTEVVDALKTCGVKQNDVVFVHSNLGLFGSYELSSPNFILECYKTLLKEDGVLVVPTFTYSFCKNEDFDVLQTMSTCGSLSEHVRSVTPFRSQDANFSVACVGLRSESFISNVSARSFDEKSFWARFLAANGIICNLNLNVGSTFLHFVERELHVPYRTDVQFCGNFVQKDQKKIWGEQWHFARDLNDHMSKASFKLFHETALSRGIAKRVSLKKGVITAIRATDAFDMCSHYIKSDPWFLTQAGKR